MKLHLSKLIDFDLRMFAGGDCRMAFTSSPRAGADQALGKLISDNGDGKEKRWATKLKNFRKQKEVGHNFRYSSH
jgi:hypothetical protein